MTLDELKQTEWYKERPKVIQEAIKKKPPIIQYQFKNGKRCHIVAYNEPESGDINDVTVIVQKTGEGGPLADMGLGHLDRNQVFDVKLDDLSPFPIPN